jgi:hypothetical protein
MDFWTAMAHAVLRQPNMSELQALSELHGVTSQKMYSSWIILYHQPLRGERDGANKNFQYCTATMLQNRHEQLEIKLPVTV